MPEVKWNKTNSVKIVSEATREKDLKKEICQGQM